jgi:hypothetical protein
MKTLVAVLVSLALASLSARAHAQTDATTGVWVGDGGLPPLPTTTTIPPPPPPPPPVQVEPTTGDSTQIAGSVNAPRVDVPGPYGGPTDDMVTGTPGARAVGYAPPGVNYSNFMDTRLTWTFGTDDVLHPTGELIPLSQLSNIGDRPQYRLFFDSLNSRYAGRENLTHLVLYKKMPGFIKHLTTEAAVVLRFDLDALAANTGNLNQALYDTGSYIRIFYETGGTALKPQGFSATFMPLDADRVRVGYLYDISWGGSASYINQSIFPSLQGSAPGAKFQYDGEKFYAFGAFKTGTIVQPEQVVNPGGQNDVETVNVGQTNYGFLGGVGMDVTKNFRFDVSGGYFQQGKFDLEDVRGLPVYTYGGAARIVVHDNMPVPQSVDFRLYRNDPNAPMTLFALPVYHPELTRWSVSVETDVLGQHLKNYDVEGETKDELGYAVAAQGVLETGYLRLSLTGIMRNLEFVVRNVPGFVPFESMPAGSQSDPELFGAASADYHFPKWHLTPGVAGGVQLPSTFKSDIDVTGLGASQRTIVVRSQGDESILPYGQDRRPIFQARASLRWDLSRILSAVGWVQVIYDNNATLVITDPNEGTASLRVFQDPWRLGFVMSLQARY